MTQWWLWLVRTCWVGDGSNQLGAQKHVVHVRIGIHTTLNSACCGLQAAAAISTLNGVDLGGRRILVREDREDRDIKGYTAQSGAPPPSRSGRGGGRGGAGRGAGRGAGPAGGRGGRGRGAGAPPPERTGESSGLQVGGGVGDGLGPQDNFLNLKV
jgi:hypothetical protein